VWSPRSPAPRPWSARPMRTAPTPCFQPATGIALDGSGNIFVADTGNGTIRRIDSQGAVTTFAGQRVETAEIATARATGRGSRLPPGSRPTAAANLYVSDAFHRYHPQDHLERGGGRHWLGVAPFAVMPMARERAATFITRRAWRWMAPAICMSRILITTHPQSHSAGVVTTLAGDYRYRARSDGTGSNAYFNQPAALRWTYWRRLCCRFRQLHDPEHHAERDREDGRRIPPACRLIDGRWNECPFQSAARSCAGRFPGTFMSRIAGKRGHPQKST